MDSETEVIRQQMEGTRTALSEKLEKLEAQVTEKVQSATESVAGTVQTVTDTVDKVSDTVGDTVEAVKNTFDLNYHAERHPWMLIGGAVVLGFVGSSLLLGSNRSRDRWERDRWERDRWERDRRRAAEPMKPQKSQEEQPGFLGQLGHELLDLKKIGIGMAMGLVRDVVAGAVPATISPMLSSAMNNLTQKIGGQPIEGRPVEQASSEKDYQNRADSCESGCL
jgi:F0F1-type ATP synthase assembly protein I